MTSATPNSPTSIATRLRDGRIPRLAPIGVLLLRAALAFAVFALASSVAALAGSGSPFSTAAAWYMVTATLIDVGCLAVIVPLARREGLGVRDLLNFRGARDLLWLPVVILLFVPAALTSAVLTSLHYPGAAPPEIAVVDLPPLAAAYAVLVWPALWGLTEEMTYLGYVLPRLEAMSGRGLAVVLVAIVWSLQHLALPFLPDTTYLIHRAITPLPVVAMTIATYFIIGRRLLPLVVAHWLADMSSALLAVSTGS